VIIYLSAFSLLLKGIIRKQLNKLARVEAKAASEEEVAA